MISALFIYDEGSGAVEINVIKAAEKSKTTKRYIISNWGVLVPSEE